MTKRPVVPCQDYALFERALREHAKRDERTAAEKLAVYGELYASCLELRAGFAPRTPEELKRRRFLKKADDRIKAAEGLRPAAWRQAAARG